MVRRHREAQPSRRQHFHGINLEELRQEANLSVGRILPAASKTSFHLLKSARGGPIRCVNYSLFSNRKLLEFQRRDCPDIRPDNCIGIWPDILSLTAFQIQYLPLTRTNCPASKSDIRPILFPDHTYFNDLW